MAHTTQLKDTVFVHNSDMSGDVTIKNENGELNVNCNDVKLFILNHLREQKIGELENMNDDQLYRHFVNTIKI